MGRRNLNFMKNNLVTYLKSHCLSVAVSLLFLVFMVNKAGAQDGKTLFKQNCGVCHTTTQQKLVGPGLEGVTNKYKEEWLVKWIKDSQALVQSGDAEAKAAFDAGGGVVMPPFATLTDDNIKAIIGFLGSPAPAAAAPAPASATQVAAPKAAAMSSGMKLFLAIIVLAIAGVMGYIMMLKKKLNSMGYAMDTLPFKDRASKFIEQNGRFLIIVAVLVILAVMKSCISHLM